MALILTQAQEADAPRIAEIHMAALYGNAMLLAQFPLPQSAQIYSIPWSKRQDKRFATRSGLSLCSKVGQDPVRVVVGLAKWRRPMEGSRARSYSRDAVAVACWDEVRYPRGLDEKG
ncbi:hypothetical protein BDV38DRAFT_279076 [Aspergillus pseudotamarii]|uniref:Uncharacterized protein n=1 Tax=Aspergillus pseudotamarii TaxID=132259 RepID=A0A5N6T656_ASPPS|nr:uncharacterized protein BDV38DRAFT_279076 [Aspergillus pseudotamarii]KAE8141729.1 hypothetical protein BDV38DRAFT_279076 [Aspergillus pseudotamarii]